MSDFTNLPGIRVSIADGGLILPEDATTQSMLIIAPSLVTDAPTEPVMIRESADLTAQGFGDVTVGSQVNPISLAWKAAFDGGCRSIYLMSLVGANDTDKFTYLQDKLFGILEDFSVDHVVVVDAFADKEVSFTATPVQMDGVTSFQVTGSALTFPLTVTAATNDTISVDTKVLTLVAQSYATIDDLVTEINAEIAANGTLVDLQASAVNGKVVLSSQSAFSLDAATDAAGLVAGSATATGNFARLLGAYAENQTLNHSATIAYIGASAPVSNSLTDVKTKVDALTALTNQFSGYVSVIAGPEFLYQVDGLADLQPLNGVVAYAALVSTLRPESAPTQKRVYGMAGVNYKLSLRQLNSLTGAKYVTFRVKNNQVIVTDGVTTAPDITVAGTARPSDYARLSTLRITQAAAQLVRDICDPFIGEPNRMPQYNALNAAIKAGLEAMKSLGAIMDYRFTVVARGATLNEAVITLEIVPAFELRKVTVNVSLTTQIGQ